MELPLVDVSFPSGALEQPAKDSDTEHEVEYALASRDAEPMARHTSHYRSGYHGSEDERPTNHQKAIDRMVRPAGEPAENQQAGHA
jgi:hypothetical protein